MTGRVRTACDAARGVNVWVRGRLSAGALKGDVMSSNGESAGAGERAAGGGGQGAGPGSGSGVGVEAEAAKLRESLDAVQRELRSARESLVATERRLQIERELERARAVDLETARLMTEAAIGAMSEPDVRSAVEELRRRKPFLFRSVGAIAVAGSPTLRHAGARASGAERGASEASPAGLTEGRGRLREEAQRSGDQRALLKYLRSRRAG